MPSLLRIVDLKKSYYITKTQKQDVLKGINVEFENGELVALLGESGCGKSTLINILGGLDNDYTGSIVNKGHFLRDYTEKEMDDYRKKRVGMIFQNYNLISHMTIIENVQIAMTISDVEEDVKKQRAFDLLKMVGLSQYADKLPNQLSGGQKQRVAIARSLANNPTIILADEPTGALDKDASLVVMQILKKIAENGKLVIVVTHSNRVASLCSRVITLEDGLIINDEKREKIEIKKNQNKEISPKSIKTKDLFKLSLENIKQKKSRNLLVSIGMAIGIAAVILILCLSRGLTNYVNDIYTSNLQSMQMTVSNSGKVISSDILEDIEEIEGIEEKILSTQINDATFTYDTANGDVGYVYEFYESFYPDLLYGELPSDENEVTINISFASALENESIIACIGKNIILTNEGNTVTYKISGIYDDSSEYSSEYNAYINESAMSTLYGMTNPSIRIIYVTVEDATYLQAVTDDFESLGLTTYQVDNTALTVLNYINLGTSVLTGVSAISMVVAAIMIFIVLYISIIERMQEIGILRAVGARKKDIRSMFMFEAGFLGLAGGVIGCIGCLVISIVVNVICKISLEYTLISYNVLYYLLGLILSITVSVLAGIAPAIKASELDPVEALRTE